MASQPKISHRQNPDSVITDHSLMMGTRTEMKMRRTTMKRRRTRTTMNRRRTRMRMNRRKLLTNVCGESCVSCQLRVVLFPSLPITAPLFPLPITAHPHLGTHRVSTNHCSIKQPSSSSFSSYVVPIYTCNQKQSNPSLFLNSRCPTFIILSADIPFSLDFLPPALDSSINQKLLFTAST